MVGVDLMDKPQVHLYAGRSDEMNCLASASAPPRLFATPSGDEKDAGEAEAEADTEELHGG